MAVTFCSASTVFGSVYRCKTCLFIMPSKCCVPKCPGEEKVKMHGFPADVELFTKWCHAIGRPDLCAKGLQNVRRSYRVCDVHFDENSKFIPYHNRTNLRFGSVPTLYLPGQQTQPLLDIQTDVQLPSANTEHIPFASADVSQQIDEQSSIIMASTISQSDVQRPSTSDIASAIKAPASKEFIVIENVSGDATEPIIAHPKIGIVPRRRTSVASKLKRNLLQEVHIRGKKQLTPKAAKLYTIAREYRNIARQLSYKNETNQKKIKQAIKLAESGAIFKEKINGPTLRFLQSQITQQLKKPKGRRFTFEDKLLSIALLKQSPRGYRLLQKIFALPSRKTLMSLLKKVPFHCGINYAIFQTLQVAVSELKARDKHCVLMFDEMALQPFLTYNKAEHYIDGFEEISDGRSNKISDHVMVFMIKGLASRWKQPVAYFFTQHGMKNPEIAKNVKIIVSKLFDIGLTVVATVCDQYNKAAINQLVDQTKQDVARLGDRHETYTFKVGEEEIIPIFDFPHLLKGIRNNFLKYDVRYKWLNQYEIGSWRHIEQLYHLDSADYDEFRMLHLLTDQHVRIDKIKKMKVKHAAQIFSQRVGSVMRGLVRHGHNALPAEAMGTAHFLLFVDKLFDSVNSSSVKPLDGKVLRCAVSLTTNHMVFWDEAIRVLETVRFFNQTKEFVPPSITNWVISLRNTKLIWQKLQNSDFTFLCTRNLNQDPLEIFFSCIRSYGARNINPSSASFRTTFKSLIVNNFLASHSPHANCEQDESEGILSGLNDFLRCNDNDRSLDVIPLDYADNKKINLKPVKGDLIIKVYGYVAGFMAKGIIKSVNKCQVCLGELRTDVIREEHSLIVDLEYRAGALLKPRAKFVLLFGMCNQILSHFMPRLCNENDLKLKIVSILKTNINSDIFDKCQHHDLYSLFLNKFVDLYLFTYVANVNKILKGNSNVCNGDPIKKQARELFMKYRIKYDCMKRNKQLQ